MNKIAPTEAEEVIGVITKEACDETHREKLLVFHPRGEERQWLEIHLLGVQEFVDLAAHGVTSTM